MTTKAWRGSKFSLLALLFIWTLLSVPSAQASLVVTGPANTLYRATPSIYVTPQSHPFVFYNGGPCAGQSFCMLNTYAERPTAISITYNGRWWSWDTDTGRYGDGSGGLLTQNARFIAGPCAGVSGANCNLGDRYFYTNSQGRLREVAVAARSGGCQYWAWDVGNNFSLVATGMTGDLKCMEKPSTGGSRPRP